MGVDELAEIHIAVVALDDFGLGLDGADNLLDAAQFARLHLGSLVEQHNVTKLDLLDDKILEVFLPDVLLHQFLSVAKFVFQSQCVHHRGDAVEAHEPVFDVLRPHRGNGADGLRDGSRLTNAAGLDHDIVKLAHGCDFGELLHEIHFQCAADATVLQSHQRVVFLPHYAAFLYEVGVDIDLPYVVDYHGKLDAALVRQDSVYKGCFAAA